jgi:preprotein translocase subunit SecE
MAGIVPKTRTFLEDVRDQMQKVTWPDWPQLKNSTFIILVFVVIVTIIIFFMDVSASAALDAIRTLAGG